MLSLLRDNWDLRGAKRVLCDLRLIEVMFSQYKIIPSLTPLFNGSVRATVKNGSKLLVVEFPPFSDEVIFFKCVEKCEVNGERDIQDLSKLLRWIIAV